MEKTVSSIPWITRIAYALPALALAVIGIPVYVFLPKFYTDTIGIDISTVGFLLLAVRLFDAVTDPVIGYLSDKSATVFGRRRPFMAFGALGLSLSLLFLFIPPASPGVDPAFRFGFWLFTLFFFWTLVTIPYESLGPEMTTDYHERTTLFGLRDGFLILGTLIAAASPAVINWIMGIFNRLATEQDRFYVLAVLYAPMIIISCAFCIWQVRENPAFKKSRHDTIFKGLFDVLQNRPFLILLMAYTISAFGSNLPATLILYYVEYVLEAQNAEVFLLVYFLTGIIFLPLWIAISRRIGKRNAWIMSMVINTGAFAGVFFLGPGDSHIYGVLVFFSGIGFGAGLALPSSIQADVIDYDELKTGQRREGRYIGLWSVSKKMAAAFGIGIGLLLLGNTGYTPNIPQGKETADMLRILYALVPCLCNTVAILIISFYPITEKYHAQIRDEIKKKRISGNSNKI